MNPPTFKAVITQPIEVHLEGSSYYRTARTMEEAQAFAAEMEAEALERWVEENSDAAKREKYREFVVYNVDSYVQHLKRLLWQISHEEDHRYKAARPLVKQLKDELKGILEGKLCVQLHQSFSRDNQTHYTVEKTSDEERKEMGVKP